jgi:hypothetical protein
MHILYDVVLFLFFVNFYRKFLIFSDCLRLHATLLDFVGKLMLTYVETPACPFGHEANRCVVAGEI